METLGEVALGGLGLGTDVGEELKAELHGRRSLTRVRPGQHLGVPRARRDAPRPIESVPDADVHVLELESGGQSSAASELLPGVLLEHGHLPLVEQM